MNKKIVVISLSVLVLIFTIALFFVPTQKEQGIQGITVSDVTVEPVLAITMNLSNQKLEKVPSHVFDQKDLEALDISENEITGALQAEIRQLSNLRFLNAANNLMTGVPAEIGQLSKLERLDLSNNKLTGLPYELGNLKNLKYLNLSGNNYSKQDLDIIKKTLPDDVEIIL